MNFILFDKWIKSCNFVRMLTFSTYKSSPPPFPPPPLKLKKKKKKILRAYMSSGWLCEFIVNSHVTGEQYWLSSLLTQRGRTVVLDRRPYREGALGKWSMTLLRGGMLNFYNIYWNVIHLFCEVTRRYWTLSRHRTPCVHRTMWTYLIWYLEHINLNYSIFKW